MKSELEQELAADELKRSLRETRDALRETGESLRDAQPTPAPTDAATTGESDGERRD